MKTVQMTIDEDLIKSVDKVAKKLHTTRSAFTRAALRNAINNLNDIRLEKEHRKGYETYPVRNREFSVWENEQDWGNL